MSQTIPPLLAERLRANTTHRPDKQWRKPKFVHKLAISAFRLRKHVQNMQQKHATQKAALMPIVIARHQSLLLKKLGDNNEALQIQKIKNLDIAAKSIDGIVIQPGQTFSYWYSIKRPQKKHGYVDGMLLSQGKVIAGIGGGLCQLSNLLYWLCLHGPFEIVERSHHSYDVFPDSGRVLPFGSGATVFYNYVDLVVKNISTEPQQLHIWLTDRHLKGQILSTTAASNKFSVHEENHYFVHWHKHWYRYNELYRDYLDRGKLVKSELITTNLAPVLYPVSKADLITKQYQVLEI